MVLPASGAVALIRTSDENGGQLVRPVYVLSRSGEQELLVCQITSRPGADFTALPLGDGHFEHGLLGRDAFVRPGRIFSIPAESVYKVVGRVTAKYHANVTSVLTSLLKGPMRQDDSDHREEPSFERTLSP